MSKESDSDYVEEIVQTFVMLLGESFPLASNLGTENIEYVRELVFSAI